MSKPTLSVALCTYNGSDFLQVQLESIARQSRLPDELVICDDSSTDDTLEIVQRFAATALFDVNVVINPVNLGSTTNFGQAISLCTGEVIALCDQDDVWIAHKLEALMQTLAHETDAGYVFSDMFDWSGASLDRVHATQWQQGRFDSSQFGQMSPIQQVRDLLKFDRVTGATMAFRAKLKPYVLPISSAWFHDGWIALLLTCLGYRGVPIDQPLVYYRSHAGQQTAIGREGLMQRTKRSRSVKYDAYMRQAQRFDDVRSRLQVLQTEFTIKDLSAINTLLTEKKNHLAARASLHAKPPWRRIVPFAQEFRTGHYHRYSDTWYCIVKDLFF